MKNNQVTFLLVTLAFLVVVGFSTQALAGETYKMACSLAITGPTSDVGSPYAKGVEDYTRYVNDEKLLGDDQLITYVRDDGYKTEVTKRNFEEFLDEDRVVGVRLQYGIDVAHRLALAARGPQLLAEPRRIVGDHRVGAGEDVPGRPVILLERDDLGGRHELVREPEDIFDLRRAERVDRLRVVTDHGDALSIRLQRPEDLCLHDIRVLVLIDEYVIEHGADRVALRPVPGRIVGRIAVLGVAALCTGAVDIHPCSVDVAEAASERQVDAVASGDGTRLDVRGTRPRVREV